eukprot:SAG22_NODE_2347_length_2683_cov_2.671053_2_plen_84_part_00
MIMLHVRMYSCTRNGPWCMVAVFVILELDPLLESVHDSTISIGVAVSPLDNTNALEGRLIPRLDLLPPSSDRFRVRLLLYGWS